MRKRGTVQNLQSRLQRYLPQGAQQSLRYIRQTADAHGLGVYLVGGAVRDLFMRRKCFDIDIVLEGDALDFARNISWQDGVKLIKHHDFGTVKLQFQKFNMDIASARRESYSRPGALPLVAPGTIREDLLRRDFTVNIMAICLNKSRFGELLDPYRGQTDLHHKLIRVLHTDSFVDDATRIFRAIRYEQRLNFAIEPSTLQLLRENARMVSTLSADRVRNELYLMLREKTPEKPLLRAHGLGVLQAIHHSLAPANWLAQGYQRARRVAGKNDLLSAYLLLLVYNMSPHTFSELQGRLNFPGVEYDLMANTLRLKTQLHRLASPGLKPFAVYRMLRDYPPAAVQANLLAGHDPLVQSRLSLYLRHWRGLKPLLNGDDLIAAGISKGPHIRAVLDSLLQARINGEITTRAGAKRLLQELMRGNKYC
jgi:tRNA nucleotidyltransferase (CCA-adding enzyme)